MLSFEITKMWIAVLKINLLCYLFVIFGTLSFPTEPVGRVTSNCADRGDQVYLVPSNLCIWLSFFSLALWEAYSASPDLTAKFKGRWKEVSSFLTAHQHIIGHFSAMERRVQGKEWVKHGWSNNGRRGKDGGGKGRGSASTPPHPRREVPSNFPAAVAPMKRRTRPSAPLTPPIITSNSTVYSH